MSALAVWRRPVLICRKCDNLADACTCPGYPDEVTVDVIRAPEPEQTGCCSNCGTKVIGSGYPYWEEVVGWTQRRAGGGANHVADRRPTGRLMCEGCMHLTKAPATAPML